MFNRRSFLQLGGISGLGFTLADYMQLKADDAVHDKAKAQSVIYIYLPGGFAAQETFDPKPLAPVEYRGSMASINTSVPGLILNELFKNTAKIADKITIIKSMTHSEAAHERGTNNIYTGWKPSPSLQYPSIGSIISHELGIRKSLPPYITIPNLPNEYAGPGYLSDSFAPFSIGSNPEDKDFRVRDLRIPKEIDNDRFEKRKRMLEIINSNDFNKRHKNIEVLQTANKLYEDAFELMTSENAINAFDLDKEPEQVKENYGKNSAGMRMLLSRRLIEAGVRFVSMTYGSWDMHTNIISGINNQLPPFDQAFAALINDLDQRGLLDTTLVVVTTEFGRTPKINKDAGRDHWPRVFSTVLSGGGIKRGFAYGQSDSVSNDVLESPVDPKNLASTIYNLLGIDHEKVLYAPGDRPVKITDDGRPIKEIIA